MYKEFDNLDALMQELDFDKNSAGTTSERNNRYPIRFVLFDSFADAHKFISTLHHKRNVIVESVASWMDSNYADVILTHYELTVKIRDYICTHQYRDSVISPFSELARFYKLSNFNTLISTLKSIQSEHTGFEQQNRVYIPIVGLSNKMSKFFDDIQVTVWYYKSNAEISDCKLILCNDCTYRIKDLDKEYTIITSVQEWLNIWKDTSIKSQIILTSPAIFANANHAQPDNALRYLICHNAYDFLTSGLNLSFPGFQYREKEHCYWEHMATIIDFNNFNLTKFLNRYFHVADITELKAFLRTWFECTTNFDKWLLSSYLTSLSLENNYISYVLKKAKFIQNTEFYTAILLTIFDLDNPSLFFNQRLSCLTLMREQSIIIPAHYINQLITRIQEIAENKGIETALDYFSSFSYDEKKLLIDWFASEKIQHVSLECKFPELFNYLNKTIIDGNNNQKWAAEYIDLYKLAKVKNTYENKVSSLIHQKNKDETTFISWYEDFKSIKSLFNNRTDIDIYYWIDGLGIEWISYIKWVLQQHEPNGIYLNELHVARALYPTTTDCNKPVLEAIASEKLHKKGDLDELAHNKKYKLPYAIVDELKVVKDIIDNLLFEFEGKTIAIISDHGLTALSQLRKGLKLAGIKSSHHGRTAAKTNGVRSGNPDYIYCDDNETICALKHESLSDKVAIGQSAHGGCTPEEILVPVFIISPNKQSQHWKATIITNTVLAVDSILQFSIKGIKSNETPYLRYKNVNYSLNNLNNDLYVSPKLNFEDNAENVELIVGNHSEHFSVEINLGVVEDDLFDM